jgi:ABC-type Fe3+-hydroxamate transport system substrate-binding protein
MGRVGLAALAAALLASGCGERPEPVDEAAVSYPVTVGGKTFAEPPEGVAVAEESSMPELLEELRFAGRGETDVFLAWASERGAATAETAARGYVAADATVREVVRSIAEIGLILDRTARAREVIQRINAQRTRVRTAVEGRTRVRVFVDLGFYATAGERTLIGDLIRAAGGDNVAGATPEPGPFPLRLLAERDPEVYVISSDSRTLPDDLRKNPRTRGMTAVREGRIVAVPGESLVPGPRIGEGLLAIARALHPDAFD